MTPFIKEMVKVARNFLSLHNFLFVIIKYLEYAIIAFIYFRLAKIIGPVEYGKATPGFIAISYSGFIMLGLTPYIVKEFASFAAKKHNEFNEQALIYYQLLYVLIASFLIVIILEIFFKYELSFIVSLVCAARIIMDILVTIHRVRNRVLQMNLISFSFSVVFLAFFLWFPVHIYSFFCFWAIGLLIGIIVGLGTLKEDIFNDIVSYSEFKTWLKINFYSIFKECLTFGILGIVTVVLSSLDKLLLLDYISEELMGNFQLADNLAMVATLAFGAINYLASYNILSNLASKKLSVINFMNKSFLVAFIVGVVLIILTLLVTSVLTNFFENYNYLNLFLPIILTNRYLDLVFTIPCLILINKSLQNTYTKFLFILSIFIFIIINIFISLSLGENIIYFVVVTQIAIKLCFLMIMYKKILHLETHTSI